MNTQSSLVRRAALALIASSSFALAACGGADPTEPTSELGEITTPSQCSGALPDVCEVCADGASECAHWVVEKGQCDVEICPGGATKSPAPPSKPTPPTCSGALPNTCEVCSDGTSECAHWVVLGGECEVEICPGGTSPTPPPTPTCTGALPKLCMTCSDGKDGCAHWEVVGGKCEIEYCD